MDELGRIALAIVDSLTPEAAVLIAKSAELRWRYAGSAPLVLVHAFEAWPDIACVEPIFAFSADDLESELDGRAPAATHFPLIMMAAYAMVLIDAAKRGHAVSPHPLNVRTIAVHAAERLAEQVAP